MIGVAFTVARMFFHQSWSWEDGLVDSKWLENPDSSSWTEGDYVSESYGLGYISMEELFFTSWRR